MSPWKSGKPKLRKYSKMFYNLSQILKVFVRRTESFEITKGQHEVLAVIL